LSSRHEGTLEDALLQIRQTTSPRCVLDGFAVATEPTFRRLPSGLAARKPGCGGASPIPTKFWEKEKIGVHLRAWIAISSIGPFFEHPQGSPPFALESMV
jgi:hypothetical protein